MAGRPATSIVAAKARAVRWKAAGLDMGIPGLVGARMLDRSAGTPGEGGPDGSAAVQRCPRDAKPERNRNADARGRTRLRPKKRRPGVSRAFSASVSDVVASADATAAEPVDDCQQDHRADQRDDEAHDRNAVVDRTCATQRADQPATDQGADDTDDDVEQDALLTIALHDDACQPADDAADDQPDEDSHACLPVSGGTPRSECGP